MEDSRQLRKPGPFERTLYSLSIGGHEETQSTKKGRGWVRKEAKSPALSEQRSLFFPLIVHEETQSAKCAAWHPLV